MEQFKSRKNFFFYNTKNGKQICRILICFSGKRKTGKDFVAFKLLDFLQKKNFFSENIELIISVVGISYLLKNQFALLNNLNCEELKLDNLYKEKVRKEMVDFGNKIRTEDSSYFCRKALESTFIEFKNQKNKNIIIHIIIVSDCRRLSDLKYFKSLTNFKFKKGLLVKNNEQINEDNNSSLDDLSEEYLPIFIRIEASEEVRIKRGYIFTSEIDDAETECDLDFFSFWDLKIQNNNDPLLLDCDFNFIYDLCVLRLKKFNIF